ncbi:E3 ubiquitin-protein ligase RBBP6 isoform X2 [Corythoichthys intestinalis]|uniref:E3 ubiquitin-protein ligase RBBP6 isoform X2 n=1 Tax=Corythoichthys intestinalis TaxID=161448 RepID=UPI0025A56653|nr:E3 ubiquitin-protein ligase RBBP6 isoform X2 [Corythoichthys intestinalis]
MTHIHYKFSSKLSYATVVFDGPQVTLTDLKEQIMGREKLRAGDCDLQITNAQTKEEYTDDEGLIPKGSSVIVRRVPNIRVSVKKTQNVERSDSHCYFASGAVKARDDHSSSKTLPLFSKMVNLAAADVSEDDKIKVVMNQSSYDPMTYIKKFNGALPANNICYRCGNVGHHSRKCPSIGEKNFDNLPKIKKSTGIPRSFMVEVDDPNIKGAMLTSCGRFAIPAIDAQAYAVGKKEKHPFLHQEESKLEEEKVPVPEELQCLICRDLLVDSVVIPCCGNSYCDDCIRTALLDSEGHVCPTCNQSDVSPDTLIANKFLRQAVNNFQKEKGYTRSLKGMSDAPQPLTTKPTPLTLQQEKNLHSTVSQEVDVNESQAHCAASLSPCVQAGEKTPDELVADAPEVSHNKEITADPSQLTTLVNNDPVQKSSTGDITPTNLQSSSSYSVRPTGVVDQQLHPLPPSSSSNPPVPPPLFLSHQFHPFPPGQQFLNHPPRHPVPPLNWTHPSPQVAPNLPLIPSSSSSSSSIPPFIQRDWYNHHRHETERSPLPRSTYRRSSHSKSKSSHSSSRSSRSRSRSHSRSRPRSPYSRHRVPHDRTNSSRSYSYGYKRSHSPTPSSSSSPREGSRSTSHSDHRKKRHNKKSSQSGYTSKKRVEQSPTSSSQAEGQSGQCYAREQTSSRDLNTDYYQQWKRQYKEWYDKYFTSFVNHYHRMPPPLHSLPPPPNPLWVDQADNLSNHKSDFSQFQYTRSPSTHHRSPPSQSSSDSRSSRSPSSNESRSPPSRSWSECSSPPSRSPSDTCSPPSKNATPHWGCAEKEGYTVLKREYKEYDKVVPEDNSSYPDAAHSMGKNEKIPHRDASDSVENPLKLNRNKKEKQQRPESENKPKRSKVSNSWRQDEDRCQKIKHMQKAQKGDKDTRCEFYKTGKKSKDVGVEKDKEKSSIKASESGGYMQINLENIKSPQNLDKEQEQKKKEKKARAPSMTNIWTDGGKLKPQKKISININLNRGRPEDKIGKKVTCSEMSDVKDDCKKLDARTDNQKTTGLHELRGADQEDGTEFGKKDAWQSPNKEVVMEGLKPQEELVEGLKPKEELVEGLKPQEELVDGLKPKEELVDGLKPKEELVERLKPQEELVEGLKSQEELVEGLQSQEELLEGLQPQEELLEGLQPQEELLEGLQPQEELLEGLQPQQELAEGLQPQQELAEGLQPQQELAEGLQPQEELAEGLQPQQELAEGLQPQQELAEGLQSHEELAEGLQPQEELAEGLQPQEELAEGLQPQEELAEGLQPQEELAEGLQPQEALAEGLQPQEALAEGLQPQEALAEGLQPQEALAEGLQPQQALAEGLQPQQALAEGLQPQQALAEGLQPQQALAEGLQPQQALLEGLQPQEELLEGLQPQQELVSPKEEMVAGQKPKELVLGVKMKSMTTESADFVKSHSSERPNITVESDWSFTLASNSNSILDHRDGEESPERIKVTTSLQEQKHNQDAALELMQAPLFKFDNEDRDDDKTEVSVAPPVTQGYRQLQGDAEKERQMSVEERTNEKSRESNSCLTPSSGQNGSDRRDAEIDGKIRPQDDKKDCRIEEAKKEIFKLEKESEQEMSNSPKLQSSSLTVHHPDRKDKEQGVNTDASDEKQPIGYNDCKKQQSARLDVKSERAKYDYHHIDRYHNNDKTESKPNNTSHSLPSTFHPFERQRVPLESNRSKLRPNPVSKRQHEGRTTTKPRPESREELWKRYKLEKLLKESQQMRAANEPEPEKEADCHYEAKPERAGGEKPSEHDSNVKNSEHERRPKKHKTDKQHGDADQELETMHKKSKKRHEGSNPLAGFE